MSLSAQVEEFKPDNLMVKGPFNGEPIQLTTGNLKKGSVLGRILFAASAALAGTGNGTCTLIKMGKDFKYGAYTVACVMAPLATVHQGIFQVTDPSGYILGNVMIPVGTGTSAGFSHPQISFLLTDGSTDFDATSVFTITVTDGVPTTSAVSGTGNGTMLQVEGHPDVIVGAYTVTCSTAITNGGKFTIADPNGTTIGYAYASKYAGTGNGTITEIKKGPLFKDNGPYIIACTVAATNGGTFSVTDPDGTLLGTVTITPGAGASATFWHNQISFKVTDGSTDFIVGDTFTLYWYENSHLGFVIWDGSTDFIVGDVFTITVTKAGRAVKLVNKESNDGSQWPAGILSEDVDASSAVAESAMYTMGTFNENALYFDGNETIEDYRLEMMDKHLFTQIEQRYV